MIVQRGDDLDDDFVPDDLVALSDDDDAGHSADGDDVNALLSAEEDVPENPEVLRVQAAATEKKRKRRVKEKERKAKVRIRNISLSFKGACKLTVPVSAENQVSRKHRRRGSLFSSGPIAISAPWLLVNEAGKNIFKDVRYRARRHSNTRCVSLKFDPQGISD